MLTIEILRSDPTEQPSGRTSWSATGTGTGGLPFTGADVGPLLGLAALLVAAGPAPRFARRTRVSRW